MYIGADSTGVVVRDSSADRNNLGFMVEGAVASLVGNSASQNMRGFQISHAHFDQGSTLEGNVARENSDIGYFIDSSWNNELMSNRAAGNLNQNFNLNGSVGNVLIDNLAEGTGTGFLIHAEANDNVIRENTAVGFGRQPVGFEFSSVSGNVVENNLASGYLQGFATVRESNFGNTFRENLAEGNGEGFADGNQVGSGTAGTGSEYIDNTCARNDVPSSPDGLCSVE